MRALAILLLLLLGVVTPVAPASAVDRLGLSWDGTTWVTQLSGALFEQPGSIHTWVPGDSETEHFYARNQGGDAARLRIEYDLPPNALADDFDITGSVDGGAAVHLTPGVSWLPLGGAVLADGRIADVAVSATFRASSTNQSMGESFPIDFRVTLTEAVAPEPGTDVVSPGASVSPGPSGSPASTSPAPSPGAGGSASPPAAGNGPGADHDGTGGGALPGTGAPEVGWVIGVGAACLGGGILIVVLSRRRRDRDADAP